MVEAGRTDPAIQARVDLFYNRVPEELYNYKTDPDALVNLVADPAYADILAELRQQLANEMYRTDDFMLERFKEEFGIKGVEGFWPLGRRGLANGAPVSARVLR